MRAPRSLHVARLMTAAGISTPRSPSSNARLTGHAPTNILGARDAQAGDGAWNQARSVAGSGGGDRCHRLRAAAADSDRRAVDRLRGTADAVGAGRGRRDPGAGEP